MGKVSIRQYRSEETNCEIGKALWDSLSNTSYISVFSSLGTPDQPQLSFERLRTQLTDELVYLTTLLQFGGKVETRCLPGDVVKALYALAPSGIIEVTSDYLRLRRLCLTIIDGMLYFSDLPTGQQTAYYGTDSLALRSRLNIPSFSKNFSVLDLCAGPGIQGMASAKQGAKVSSIEINPHTASLCQINVNLNGLENRQKVYCCDLSDPSFYETLNEFDFIFANPPLLPIPSGIDYPFIGDGGSDGLDLVKKIIGIYPHYLADGGFIKIIGLSGGSLDKSGIELLASHCAQKYSMQATLTLLGMTSTRPDSEWTKGICASLNLYQYGSSPTPENLSAFYSKVGISHIYAYTLELKKTGKERVIYEELFDPTVNSLNWWV